MLTKIEKEEVMTVRETKEKYPDNWFRYRIVEKEEDCQHKSVEDTLVTVIYISDTKGELLSIPKEERFRGSGGDTCGENINPSPLREMGGLSRGEFLY